MRLPPSGGSPLGHLMYIVKKVELDNRVEWYVVGYATSNVFYHLEMFTNCQSALSFARDCNDTLGVR